MSLGWSNRVHVRLWPNSRVAHTVQSTVSLRLVGCNSCSPREIANTLRVRSISDVCRRGRLVNTIVKTTAKAIYKRLNYGAVAYVLTTRLNPLHGIGEMRREPVGGLYVWVPPALMKRNAYVKLYSPSNGRHKRRSLIKLN